MLMTTDDKMADFHLSYLILVCRCVCVGVCFCILTFHCSEIFQCSNCAAVIVCRSFISTHLTQLCIQKLNTTLSGSRLR